jgi:hypothetical protein
MENMIEETEASPVEIESMTEAQYVAHVISQNYNEHKNERNKLLSWAEVKFISIAQGEDEVRYFAITNRNDGLLYEVTVNDPSMSKVTLFLYNRIARKFITKEENA